jgi:hypothetical protein
VRDGDGALVDHGLIKQRYVCSANADVVVTHDGGVLLVLQDVVWLFGIDKNVIRHHETPTPDQLLVPRVFGRDNLSKIENRASQSQVTG